MTRKSARKSKSAALAVHAPHTVTPKELADIADRLRDANIVLTDARDAIFLGAKAYGHDRTVDASEIINEVLGKIQRKT